MTGQQAPGPVPVGDVIAAVLAAIEDRAARRAAVCRCAACERDR